MKTILLLITLCILLAGCKVVENTRWTKNEPKYDAVRVSVNNESNFNQCIVGNSKRKRR